MSNIRILVVEDERIIAQDIITRLKRMGYLTLGPVSTGKDAIALALQEKPDVILMDISLKGEMDGIQAADSIREQSNIPVIYVTAYSDDKIIERVKVTEPYGYLIKPFVERELRATIETAHYKHKIEEQLSESREQYRSLLHASGAVPWELNVEEMKFSYIGPQCVQVFGIQREDMLDFGTWLERIHPEDLSMVQNIYTSTHVPDTREIEYRVMPDSRKLMWIRDTVSRSTDSRGRMRIRGYMLDITRRKEAEIEREQYIKELQDAIEKIKTLHGLLPICAWCKKIRDDQGYWQQVEVYVRNHSEAEFTHSICPECKKRVEEEMNNEP